MLNVDEIYQLFKDSINNYNLEDLICEYTKNEEFSYLATIYYRYNYGNLRDVELYNGIKYELYRKRWT